MIIRRRQRRRGFSLLEVMLALAIFLIALVGLGQLMNICTDQAMEIQHINRANQLLQSAMNRVIAGEVALTGSGESSFEEDPDWYYSVSSEADTAPSLYRVTLTVSYKGKGSNDSHSWTLSQMVLDPAQRGAIQAPAAASSSGGASATPSSGGTAGGTSGGAGGTAGGTTGGTGGTGSTGSTGRGGR